jgi:hypothetical protein
LRRFDAGGELGALADRQLGIELGRHVRATDDDVDGDAEGLERGTEVAHRLLTGAQHDGVRNGDLWVGPLRSVCEVRPGIVDPLVVDADVVLDFLACKASR